MGAGVAGLQAIATAKRLGALVEVTRHPRRGQGAGRVAGRAVHRAAEHGRAARAQGGYAKEMSEEFLRQQRELVDAQWPQPTW